MKILADFSEPKKKFFIKLEQTHLLDKFVRFQFPYCLLKPE